MSRILVCVVKGTVEQVQAEAAKFLNSTFIVTSLPESSRFGPVCEVRCAVGERTRVEDWFLRESQQGRNAVWGPGTMLWFREESSFLAGERIDRQSPPVV